MDELLEPITEKLSVGDFLVVHKDCEIETVSLGIITGGLHAKTLFEGKRAVMIARLDRERDQFLDQYFADCASRGENPDLVGLMQNGMGLGAADLYSDAELDVLIATDEAKAVKKI